MWACTYVHTFSLGINPHTTCNQHWHLPPPPHPHSDTTAPHPALPQGDVCCGCTHIQPYSLGINPPSHKVAYDGPPPILPLPRPTQAPQPHTATRAGFHTSRSCPHLRHTRAPPSCMASVNRRMTRQRGSCPDTLCWGTRRARCTSSVLWGIGCWSTRQVCGG